ncbi:hypothetical protein [Nocardiopsis sp. LOL_012]|uniref:hypothetical protein n=1 Tax=Nocardiopsis sp. LOL_012 TaxID=3345409 RepID=UPI003A86CBBB
MPHQASTSVLPTAPARTDQVSLEGIGDVVDAGRRSGYAHLAQRPLPTVGRLVAAARGAAEALGRPALRPSLRGRWQPAPRAARRHAAGRIRVSVVALEPNGFVPEPEGRPGHGPALEVLFLVGGRAHLVASGADGSILSAAELTQGRARVVGSAARGRQHLVNTGDEVAVVVRVTA